MWLWGSSDRGSVAIMALIATTLLLSLGGAFITFSSTEVTISRDYCNGVAAQYLAEAGVHWAIVKLKTEPDFVAKTGILPGVTATSITKKNAGTPTEGSYTVKVAGSGMQRVITATGTVGSGKTAAKRQVILHVTLPATSTSGISIISYNNY